jgi:hypothetical protein
MAYIDLFVEAGGNHEAACIRLTQAFAAEYRKGIEQHILAIAKQK